MLLFVAAAAVYTVSAAVPGGGWAKPMRLRFQDLRCGANLAAPRAQTQPGPAATVCPCLLPRATKAAAASSVGRNKGGTSPASIGIVAMNVLHAGISRCPARQCRNCAGCSGLPGYRIGSLVRRFCSRLRQFQLGIERPLAVGKGLGVLAGTTRRVVPEDLDRAAGVDFRLEQAHQLVVEVQ